MNNLENLVKQAVEGDKKALESIVTEIQDLIYNLALRMLWHPEDAKDVTQDILIKVITNLSSFKHKSAFTTWVYRLASNTIINFKKKQASTAFSFEKYGIQLNQGLSNSITYTNNKTEQKLLVQEAKIGCSNAMLQCLNKENRLVYILGEILEFNSKEGAFILEITPENFRQKRSRSKRNLHQFMQNNCGIVNPKNNCRCRKKVDSSIKNGFIKPNQLLFMKNIKNNSLIKAIEDVENEVSLYQSNPEYHTPQILLTEVKKILTNTKHL